MDTDDMIPRARELFGPGSLAQVNRVAMATKDLLLIGAGVLVIALGIGYFGPVLLPIVLAAVGSALLSPITAWLVGRGASRVWASIGSLLIGLAAFAGLILVALMPFVRKSDSLVADAKSGVGNLTRIAADHGLIDGTQAENTRKWVIARAGDLASLVVNGVLQSVSALASIATILFLTLPLMFFMLKDTEPIWTGFVTRLPGDRRARIDRSGRAAVRTLSAFLRGTAIVASFDAVVVALGLWLIGVPFVIPLALLTFVLAFIPNIGAVLACFFAALVALATGGISAALWVVVLSLVVNQLEGIIVAPFAIGNAVSLHPAVVLISVTAGTVVAGIAGAFLAVPVVAVILAIVRTMGEPEPT
jgi:predicted PurR-regulated permease PerM